MPVYIFLSVERKGASFGEVRVYWRVLRVRSDGSTTEIPEGQEFAEVMGFVTFTSGSESRRIRLTPIDDNIAELDETFELRLINATGKLCIYYHETYSAIAGKDVRQVAGADA